MKKNVIITLLIIIILILGGYIIYDTFVEKDNYINNEVSKEDTNISDNDKVLNSEEIIENEENIKINESDKNSGENTEINEFIDIEILDKEKIENLVMAEAIDKTSFKENKFYELDLLDNSLQKVKVNNKEITLHLDLSGYSVNKGEGNLINYVNFKYNIGMYDLNVTEGSSINGIYYDTLGYFSGSAIVQGETGYKPIADITEIDAKKAIEDLKIKYGIIKDSVTEKEYIMFYITEESFATDVVYVYNDEGELMVKGNEDTFFANIIPDANNPDEYKFVTAIEFYEDRILYYDMYVDYEIDKNMYGYQEDLFKEDRIGWNCLHELTIENGKIIDKIIKIYQNVPVGQT